MKFLYKFNDEATLSRVYFAFKSQAFTIKVDIKHLLLQAELPNCDIEDAEKLANACLPEDKQNLFKVIQ